MFLEHLLQKKCVLLKLVGGFNPFEKYARQIGSSPRVGEKIQNDWNHHHVLCCSNFALENSVLTITPSPSVYQASLSATEGLSKKVPLRSKTHIVAGLGSKLIQFFLRFLEEYAENIKKLPKKNRPSPWKIPWCNTGQEWKKRLLISYDKFWVACNKSVPGNSSCPFGMLMWPLQRLFVTSQ